MAVLKKSRTDAGEDFRVIGYYICQVVDTPRWLHGISRQMLSVSGCIGEQHPRWECFMGGWLKGENEEYQENLRMDAETYREFTESVNRLFDAGHLDVDSRFLRLPDAQYFYEKVSPAIPCRLVSISTIPEYFEILAEELKSGNCYGMMEGEPDNSPQLGSDILGWDISGFHSFLCNSLQELLPSARFHDLGLLANEFHEVAGFARQIEGKGETVEWIPCRVGSCDVDPAFRQKLIYERNKRK